MAENREVWRSIAHRDDINVRVAQLPDEVGGGVLVRRDEHGSGGLADSQPDAGAPVSRPQNRALRGFAWVG